jgi:hypothetical protein
MDEATWLSSTHFQKLYGHVKSGQGMALTKAGRRRLRLFACACCRCLLWHLPVMDDNRRAVAAAEAFADRLIEMEATAEPACHYSFGDKFLWSNSAAPDSACWAMVRTADKGAFAVYEVARDALAALAPEDRPAGRKHLCDLVRDIFGNPFRPFAIESARRAPDVLRLAEAAYDERPLPSGELDNARLAVLADALEDAGAYGPLPEHLRSPGPHVRGCVALDAVLGRS